MLRGQPDIAIFYISEIDDTVTEDIDYYCRLGYHCAVAGPFNERTQESLAARFLGTIIFSLHSVCICSHLELRRTIHQYKGDVIYDPPLTEVAWAVLAQKLIVEASAQPCNALSIKRHTQWMHLCNHLDNFVRGAFIGSTPSDTPSTEGDTCSPDKSPIEAIGNRQIESSALETYFIERSDACFCGKATAYLPCFLALLPGNEPAYRSPPSTGRSEATMSGPPPPYIDGREAVPPPTWRRAVWWAWPLRWCLWRRPRDL